jgi:hypothetical protein
MAFIRKKCGYYYLVQSVRDGDAVRQITLAYLGKSPKIDANVIERIKEKYPDINIDMTAINLKKKIEREEDWLECD